MDSVVRLKVENTEYDAKIKRAAQGLQHLEDACHKAGGTLAILDDADKKFVQSLGRMETVAKSARGRLGELSTAFTDLSVRYNKLTDEEKKGDYGKALSKSLEEIRQRIIDAKGELNDINGRIQNNGSLLDQLSSKFGVNIKSLASWGTAIAAGKAALQVLEDSLMTSEQNVDDWGRMVTASEDVYKSFCMSLNNASLDSFFQNIQNVINKAKEAYNALDDLATKGGVISNKEAKLNYEKQQQMAIINDKSKSEAERKAAQQRLAALNAETKAAKKATADLNNEVVRSKIGQLLTGNGFKEGTKAYNEAYQKVVKSLYDENYKMGSVNTGFKGGMKINNGKNVRYTDNGNRNLDNIVTDEWRNEVNPYVQAVWNSLGAAESESRMINRFAQKAVTSGGGGTGSNSPAGSIGYMQKQLSKLQTAYKNATTDGIRDSLKEQITKLTAEINMMQNPLEFKTKFVSGDEESKYLMDVLKKSANGEPVLDLKGKNMSEVESLLGISPGGDGIKTFTKDDFDREEWKKKQAEQNKKPEIDYVSEFSKMTSGFTEIGSGLKSLGIDLGEGFDEAIGVVQGIMTIIQGVQTVLGVMQLFNTTNETAQTASLAAIAANTAIMAANSFSSWIPGMATGGIVHAATGFVGGTKYSGDNIPALLNSGEVVLNQAQTANLATKLSNNAEQRMNAQPYLDCEKIYLGLNTFLGATGRGELITSR